MLALSAGNHSDRKVFCWPGHGVDKAHTNEGGSHIPSIHRVRGHSRRHSQDSIGKIARRPRPTATARAPDAGRGFENLSRPAEHAGSDSKRARCRGRAHGAHEHRAHFRHLRRKSKPRTASAARAKTTGHPPNEAAESAKRAAQTGGHCHQQRQRHAGRGDRQGLQRGFEQQL